MLGLAAVLDIAKPKERILVTSFGSGAGSDSFAITVTDRIKDVQKLAPTVQELIAKKIYIEYSTYIKYRGKLRTT